MIKVRFTIRKIVGTHCSRAQNELGKRCLHDTNFVVPKHVVPNILDRISHLRGMRSSIIIIMVNT